MTIFKLIGPDSRFTICRGKLGCEICRVYFPERSTGASTFPYIEGYIYKCPTDGHGHVYMLLTSSFSLPECHSIPSPNRSLARQAEVRSQKRMKWLRCLQRKSTPAHPKLILARRKPRKPRKLILARRELVLARRKPRKLNPTRPELIIARRKPRSLIPARKQLILA